MLGIMIQVRLLHEGGFFLSSKEDSMLGTEVGLFSKSFIKFKLKEICLAENGIQTGPFGSQLHMSDYVEVGTPIITVEHLVDGFISHINLPLVSDYDRERLKKYSLKKGDIIISRVGSVDRSAIVGESEEGWLFSGRCIRVRPDESKVNSRYVAWFLQHPSVKEYLRRVAVGLSMPSLNTKIIENVPIYVNPNEKWQESSANLLDNINSAVEINRRNGILSQEIIESIFRSWFIDFDPVKAKVEGNIPYGMNQEIAALFPDSFEESELGLLPSGWKIGRIGDMANISSGKHQPKRLVERSNEYSTPLLGGTGIIGWTDESLFNEPIIVTGRVGTLGVVKKYIHPVYPSDNTLVFKTKKPSSFHYLYYQLKLQDFGAYNRGSTQPLISQSDMKKLKIIIPNNDVLLAFEEKIRPIVLFSLLIEEKCKSLAKTRDLLLPRLMSGELKVN